MGGRGDTVLGDVDIDGSTTLTLAGLGTMAVTNGRIVVGDNFNGSIFGGGSSGALNINSGTFTTAPVRSG